ncbi:MAG: FtsX-like permease family protein, partial [Fulvivirga sp.]|uniref:FtsX-like permease family protein n=1 Tax=Fulvivirga sp. TaxID=1931237 RepID=UPI0032EF8476
EIFQLELESGNAATALAEPNTVVLTKKAAIKLFGNNDPIGQVIDMDRIGEYKVTGVIKDNNEKSHIVYEALASFSTTQLLEKDSLLHKSNNTWEVNTSGWTYIELEEGKSANEVLKYLAEIDEEYYAENEDVDYRFQLQNLIAINPGPLLGNQIGPGLPMLFVYFLGGLALIVMISACFNYTNLSIAKSINRAKEVGVRKVSGALKGQIFTQFIIESVLISLFSLVVAYALVVIIEPAFASLSLATMLKWNLSFSPAVIATSVAFALGVGLLAGLLPAFLLSAFQPIKVLKDFSSMKLMSKMGLRKALLTGQLALSLFFILSVIILYKQLNILVSSDKGFKTENIINIPLVRTDGQAFKTELEKQSAIEQVTLASHLPAAGTTYGEGFKRNLSDEESELFYYVVDENYIDVMGLKLVAGRNINPEANLKNEHEIIINEKAIETFNFENKHDALGKVIYDEDSSEISIVGIIQDYNHQNLTAEIKPMALRYIPTRFHLAHVKLNSQNKEIAISQIESSWKTVNPLKQFTYGYMEDDINEFYDMTFGDLTKIIGVFSFLALSIASLGLLGMAIYNTQTRVKEIAIRKALGASDNQVIYILSKSFGTLLLLSIVVAIPLTVVVNNLWLESIAYRVTISPEIILTGTFILLIISALTIGSQTIKTGRMSPASNLKNE